MSERILKSGLTLLVLLAVGAAPASAGRYHVYSCRMPDGEVAPVDGWSGSLAVGGAHDDFVTNSCGEGGALVAALPDKTTHLPGVDRATWTFEAPPFDELHSASLWRAGDTEGGGAGQATYQLWVAAPTLSSVFDNCEATLGCESIGDESLPLNPVNKISVPTAHLGSQILLNAGCAGAKEQESFECPTGEGDPNNFAAALYLYAADLTLEQTSGPTVSAAGGELASASTISGSSDLTFTASDPGSGVYEVVFSVDGKTVQSTVPDEAGGSCHDVGQSSDGLPAFLHLQPCPSSVSAAVAFDASGLSPGPHHLLASVLDAAGNSAPILDRTISVVPAGSRSGPLPGSPNGTGASAEAALSAHWRKTTRSRLVVPFGRTETITGRLVGPGSSPIAGAQIAVSATPTVTGARAVAMPAALTAADGTFAVKVPAGASSRQIELAYSAHVGDPRPATSRTLALAVAAPIEMTIDPRTAPSMGTIRFDGKLLAGPIPQDGLPVVLEARSGRGPWIQFRVVRSDRHGRFKASYRFRFPGPATYDFRAVCEAEADYPFARGATRPIQLSER